MALAKAVLAVFWKFRFHGQRRRDTPFGKIVGDEEMFLRRARQLEFRLAVFWSHVFPC